MIPTLVSLLLYFTAEGKITILAMLRFHRQQNSCNPTFSLTFHLSILVVEQRKSGLINAERCHILLRKQIKSYTLDPADVLGFPPQPVSEPKRNLNFNGFISVEL